MFPQINSSCIGISHALQNNLDNKVHGANMEPTWVLSVPGGPHVGLTNLMLSGSMNLVLEGTSGFEQNIDHYDFVLALTV